MDGVRPALPPPLPGAPPPPVAVRTPPPLPVAVPGGGPASPREDVQAVEVAEVVEVVELVTVAPERDEAAEPVGIEPEGDEPDDGAGAEPDNKADDEPGDEPDNEADDEPGDDEPEDAPEARSHAEPEAEPAAVDDLQVIEVPEVPDTPVTGIGWAGAGAATETPAETPADGPPANAAVAPVAIAAVARPSRVEVFDTRFADEEAVAMMARLTRPLAVAALALTLIFAGGAIWWVQERGSRERQIASLTAANRSRASEIEQARTAHDAELTRLRAQFAALSVPARWTAVTRANADRQRLSQAADRRYADSRFVRTGDAFQLVAVQQRCLAAVIEYNRVAVLFPDVVRGTLPATVDMRDDALNCGVSAWQ